MLMLLGMLTGGLAQDPGDLDLKLLPLPLVEPTTWSVQVEEAGRRRRSLKWSAIPGQWKMQVSRVTDVTVAGESGSQRVQDLAVVLSVEVDPAGTIRLTPQTVEGGESAKVDVLVELMAAATWWSTRPWIVHPDEQWVELPATPEDPMDLGSHEVARLVLDSLQIAWIPLPDQRVGPGAVWTAHSVITGDLALNLRCELQGSRARRQVIACDLSMPVPEGREEGLAVSGRVWIEEGRPLPMGADFSITFGNEQDGASGVERVRIATE